MVNKLAVSQSHRVALRCKYQGATNHKGSRITVSRYDNTSVYGKDPQRVTVSWNYALEVGENYAVAVELYLSRAEWGGHWVTSTITDGAVAVCLDAVNTEAGK